MMFTAIGPGRDPHWVARLMVHMALAGVLAAALLIELQAGTGGLEYGLLIGAGLLIHKAFGHKHDDADESAQGDHPVTRFMFNAMNKGDFEGVEGIISDDFRAYADGRGGPAHVTDDPSRQGEPGPPKSRRSYRHHR